MKKCISIYVLFLFVLIPCISKAERPADYWQQEVNYRMNVTLGLDQRTIDGSIEIEYINNSPDTLDVLYLKAFPNAIQDGSYADKKRRSFGDWSLAGLAPANEGRLELRGGKHSNTAYSTFEIDNTIVTVHSTNPILPGDTLDLDFEFTTILPKPHDMRMGLTGGTIKAAYWYPQVCVYDRRMGWVNSQYLGWGECYGDFGTFDVTITAPENQIVAATGLLVNKREVLPPDLAKKLQMSNFVKPKNEWPTFEFDSSKTKSWHYVAKKVSDFAFTTSNNYCIDSGEVNGVAIVAYALRQKAKGWLTAVQLGKEAIETFSDLYYPYAWPVMRICDAFGGMEYPMITNCGGQGPSPIFSLLLYHEIGHEWFMGQVGNNQVDRPFLDEGFTTHLEHVALEKYNGREGNRDNFTNWYQRKFAPHQEDRNVRGFLPLQLMIRDGMDKPMQYSYDQGEEYFPHRVSIYYKSAAMHYSLRSILGDSAYFKAMNHYCDTWFFGHPYEDDFTHSIEEATGLQLDPYLDQWYHSRRRLDYAVSGSESRREGSGYAHTIKLKRPGRFVAPIDVAVLWQNGDSSFYTIAPEGMSYAKPGHQLMPTWKQFRQLGEKYEFTVQSPEQIRNIVIDPDNLLMDVNRMNNRMKNKLGLFGGEVEFRLDNILYDRTPVNEYALRARPDFWYDQPNGAQIGIHAHGSYLETINKFSLYARFGFESELPMIDFSYSTPFKPFGNFSEASWRILRADKRTFITSALQKKFTRWHSSRPDHELLRLEFSALFADGDGDLDPLYVSPSLEIARFVPDGVWNDRTTDYITFRTRKLATFQYGSVQFNSVSSVGAFTTNGNIRGYTQNQLGASITLNRKAKPFFTTRIEYINTEGLPPSQLLYHLSRARAIDRFTQSQLFRSPGSFPNKWESDFYLADQRVRGYQDRTLFFTDMIGGSVEITPELIPNSWFRHIPTAGHYLSQIDVGFFAEGAWITMEGREIFYNSPILNNETKPYFRTKRLYASAGLSLIIPPVWFGQKVRLDFPLYLNRPLPGDDKIAFRFSAAWVLPIGG